MLTVGSSSATDASPERDATETAENSSGKRVPLIAIPITLSVGLLVAAGYVGNRIIASRKHATAVVVASATAPLAPLVALAPAPLPAKSETVNAPEGQTHQQPVAQLPSEPSPLTAIDNAEESGNGLIVPRHGERYLQIAAISTSAAQKFLAGLSRYNLQANMAPGPHDGLVRVVIGPFPDWESVTAVKSQIQAMWPDCFVRLY